MKKYFTPEKVTWDEVKKNVQKINPELFKIIEQMNCPRLPLYKVRYPYGAKIVDNGTFNWIKENGATEPLSSDRVSKEIQKDLSYHSIPLALVLHNASEVFIEEDNCIIPLRLLTPGTMFGVFEMLDPPQKGSSAAITNISAGTRSAFMLAKISDSIGHSKLLKALHLHSPLPRGLKDHGLIFSDICHHADYITTWYNEILFFPSIWIEKQENNGWLKFINYVQQIGWNQSQYWRNQTMFGWLGKALVAAILKKNIRPRPYLIDTVKHLVFLSSGNIPGFKPAGLEELAIPLKIIQDVYVNLYGLKAHSPIIMVPHHYANKDLKDAIFYSLSYPTLLEYSLNPKLKPTTIEDLRNIKLLMELLRHWLEKENIFLYEGIKNVNFDYFTSDQDILEKVKSSKELSKIDPSFKAVSEYMENRTFPYASPFLRGCIRISRKT